MFIVFVQFRLVVILATQRIRSVSTTNTHLWQPKYKCLLSKFKSKFMPIDFVSDRSQNTDAPFVHLSSPVPSLVVSFLANARLRKTVLLSTVGIFAATLKFHFRD